MKIRQYAKFDVCSKILSPHRITEVLRVEPSRVSQLGSRQTSPPIPVFNVWTVSTASNGEVEAMVEELVDLVEQLADRLAALEALDPMLSDVDGSGYGITVVRYFNARDGVEDETVAPGDLEKLPGQHHLLGFTIEPELMRRLARLRCRIAFGEYG